ncbi:hypothetical protein [Pseudoalteromonas sp. Z9A4]|uniref:hypothetical protein n=1 Tax=Pseudoalteromonas sp. Z9A4 TaxID=2686353 RepID=UPI00140B4E38|nr:hypothetical protein [Pseudoalteromonas sp. Z9A4]
MNYKNWLQKNFSQLDKAPQETINSPISKAQSEIELFREFLKVLGSLLFIIPFNLYLYVSGIALYKSPIYWFLVIASFAVGGFIGLYCEQTLVKRRLKKIIHLKEI